jgi:hypothetical protein
MVSQEQTDKAKERALAQGVKVYLLEAGKRYVALSTTNDGTAYEVVVQSTEPGDITCSCPGATYRGVCKHIGKVILLLGADQVQVNDHLELNNDSQHVGEDIEVNNDVLLVGDLGADVQAGNAALQVNDHLEQDIADLYYR